MALLTVLAVAAKPFIPPRTLVLHPGGGGSVGLFGPKNAAGGPSVTWIDQSAFALRCHYEVRHRQESSCGFALSWGPQATPAGDHSEAFPLCADNVTDPDGDGWGWENERSCRTAATAGRSAATSATTSGAPTYPHCIRAGSDPDGDGWGWENERSCRVGQSPSTPPPPPSIDASGYEGLQVKIHYEGRADYLRLHLGNRNPAHTLDGKLLADKYMAVLLRTEDLRAGPVYVSLQDFSVEAWWSVQNNPPRQMAAPEFGQLVMVGVDPVEFGVHRIRVDEIKLIGDRISDRTYLMTLLLLWSGYLIFEGLFRYSRLAGSRRTHEAEIRSLTGDALQLEEAKVQLKNRSITDPLTGVLNRTGAAERLHNRDGLAAGCGLMVIDIDHFKTLNDAYGHAAGDRILQEFAALISGAIRDGDLFARWGGEEFILLIENGTAQSLRSTAEKLRQQVANHRFLGDLSLQVTVSIGLAHTEGDDGFNALFKRADTALYRAKQRRNTVVYEA